MYEEMKMAAAAGMQGRLDGGQYPSPPQSRHYSSIAEANCIQTATPATLLSAMIEDFERYLYELQRECSRLEDVRDRIFGADAKCEPVGQEPYYPPTQMESFTG